MASRGRRGGAPAREDEPRRDERAEQQAPAPQGPLVPPPPPVDYGVFMQGLVQAMQTQAHTQAALQAQLEAQELGVNALDAEIPGMHPAIWPSTAGTAKDRRHVLQDRTVSCVVGDTPLEETVESDSERGE
ncbi:hypothetical protein Taro_009350 [Colocasia esculenta]|uniref:Uncharacterized protein n=1 Tax=Colocasia esculenta TaxID=4460 RepID=A0A843U672_COLES|nr:hypothetical protein [Colocasia esculenta]